ncbi:hypothetical protein DQ04_17031000, partial [Trypanosoma grayi]|uniref:hypothetical protein n=1 Tax=Trypanosoma grayi TaxID=71804 RepID=UPI0004F48C74
RDDLQRREEEIRQVKDRLLRVEEEKKKKEDGIRNSAGGVTNSLLALRVKQLDAQYNKLLGAKVDAVLQEGSTARINAEVKELFAQMKAKMIADACRHEAEVLLLNESLFDTEKRLATAHHGLQGPTV